MPAERPDSLYDRHGEWADLTALVAASEPRFRLGMLYGRRRFGKSFLLRRLVETYGGLYHLALEQEAQPALDRFATAVSDLQVPPPPLQFSDWHTALSYTLTHLGTTGDRPQVLVLDEYPYLRRSHPELDSTIQSLIDAAANSTFAQGWRNPVTMILCGSAMSVMTELLSGTAPLRGRALLDMPLRTFDYREFRDFWQVDDLELAFALHAIVGGAPGYKDLTAATALPASVDDLPAWLGATVLNPSHALFREDEYLLREDPTVTKEALYYSLLNAIAQGSTAPSAIASRIGRRASDITHHLNVLVRAGFIVREDDLLLARNPSYRVADPIVRFHELITRRHRDLLEDRRPFQAWRLSQETYLSRIVGPHFETLCRHWTARYAAEATLGGAIGPVAPLQVNDPNGDRFELDVAAATRQTHNRRAKTIQVLGEAKHTSRPCSVVDLERLDRCVHLLSQRQGVSYARTGRLLLFSAHGFTAGLTAAAESRNDVELIDMRRLYLGS